MSLPEKKSEGTSPLAPPPGFIYLKYGDGPPRLHRVDCSCQSCKWARERLASGRKSKRELEAERKAAVADRKAAKLAARVAEEAAKVKRRSALETALVAQAQATGTTDIVAAAKLAGMDSAEAARVAKKEDLITTALEKAGLGIPVVLESYKEGLSATDTRIISNSRGEVTDAVAVKDFDARHKYAKDLLTAHGFIGREEQPPAAGGLIIITHSEASKVVSGHPVQCKCDECIAAWNRKTAELRRQEARKHAIDAEIVESAADGVPAKTAHSASEAEDKELGRALGESFVDPDEDEEDFYQVSPDEPKY